MERVCELPNGCSLYVEIEPSLGTRRYFSDEVGGGVFVWDTALVDQSTLLGAMVEETRLYHEEFVKREQAARKQFRADGGSDPGGSPDPGNGES